VAGVALSHHGGTTLSPAELSLTTLIGSTVLYHPNLDAIARLLLS